MNIQRREGPCDTASALGEVYTAGTCGGAGALRLEQMSTVASSSSARLMRKIKAYFALTKPRVIELLLIATVPAMVLAQGGLPPLWLIAATLLGGALSASSANAFNCYIDTDIDPLSNRKRYTFTMSRGDGFCLFEVHCDNNTIV